MLNVILQVSLQSFTRGGGSPSCAVSVVLLATRRKCAAKQPGPCQGALASVLSVRYRGKCVTGWTKGFSEDLILCDLAGISQRITKNKYDFCNEKLAWGVFTA